MRKCSAMMSLFFGNDWFLACLASEKMGVGKWGDFECLNEMKRRKMEATLSSYHLAGLAEGTVCFLGKREEKPLAEENMLWYWWPY